MSDVEYLPSLNCAKLSFIVLLLSIQHSLAQLGGESTFQFLNLVSSPRQAALGGKVLTLYDYDLNQAFFNPASINQMMDRQIALNYSSYLGGISYGTAAYAYTYDRRAQTFHLGVTYINYGAFEGYDESGLSTGSFSGNETALSLGYAYNIPWTSLYLGANLKFISSKLDQYTALGVATDLGALYINKKINLRIAIVIRNLGMQIKSYDEIKESLPLAIDLGISQRLENVPIRWHLTLENLQKWNLAEPNPARSTSDLSGNQSEEKVDFLKNAIRHVILGIEFFPEKSFNLFLGYNFRRAEELRIVEQRHFSGLSLGLSLKANKLRFSYAHARYAAATDSNFIGLIIDLN